MAIEEGAEFGFPFLMGGAVLGGEGDGDLAEAATHGELAACAPAPSVEVGP